MCACVYRNLTVFSVRVKLILIFSKSDINLVVFAQMAFILAMSSFLCFLQLLRAPGLLFPVFTFAVLKILLIIYREDFHEGAL